MDTQIVSVKENPLLERREVTVEVDHEGEATPSFEDLKSRIAAENGIDEDEIEVENIRTGYGRNVSEAHLKIHQEFEYDESLQKDPVEEEEVEVTPEYRDVVSGTITEAKDQLGEMDEPDYRAALEAEKENKDRKTLKEWLENQIGE
ncbi:MAG: hypothetical protein ABEK01_05350 [Candidatus Nanohaloarchaea archaeon]